MGRTNQTKLCFGVIVSIGDTILHKEKYISLKDIAEELNLSYHQVADISAGRKKQNTNFKYQPIIEINKISELV
tara:strand:- start:2416 stop:2637 length:222 start_codon:yes stop_codon:yes gene_type:complete